MMNLYSVFTTAKNALVLISFKSLASNGLPFMGVGGGFSSSPKMTFLAHLYFGNQLISALHRARYLFIPFRLNESGSANTTRSSLFSTGTPSSGKITSLFAIFCFNMKFSDIKTIATVLASFCSTVFRSICRQAFCAFSPKIHAELISNYRANRKYFEIISQYFEIAKKRIGV